MRTAGRASIGVGLVLALLAAALFSAFWVGGQVSTRPTDPESMDPTGAAAVAAILRDRGGVEVRTVRRSADLGAAADGTLVVSPGGTLGAQARQRVVDAAEQARTVVLIAPDESTLRALTTGISPAGSTGGVLRGNCRSEDADTGDEIEGPSRLYRSYGTSTTACFSQVGGGTYRPSALQTQRSPDGRRVIVLGAVGLVTNQSLRSLDHAAIALRLLGHHAKLTWYVPSPELDVEAAARPDRPWPPPWLEPLVLALLGGVVALMLYRGRRLGRLAVEPLPVIVQAHETTLARGRLYRRSRDPAHVAGILQAATTRRLARDLGLQRSPTPADVAEAAARATGRHTDHVLTLLTTTPAQTKDLARLSEDLHSLEKEVRRA